MFHLIGQSLHRNTRPMATTDTQTFQCMHTTEFFFGNSNFSVGWERAKLVDRRGAGSLLILLAYTFLSFYFLASQSPRISSFSLPAQKFFYSSGLFIFLAFPIFNLTQGHTYLRTYLAYGHA